MSRLLEGWHSQSLLLFSVRVGFHPSEVLLQLMMHVAHQLVSKPSTKALTVTSLAPIPCLSCTPETVAQAGQGVVGG